MSEISEVEIKSMSKEQNYMRGYEDGKSDTLDKLRAEIIENAKRTMNDTRAEGLYMALNIIDKYR